MAKFGAYRIVPMPRNDWAIDKDGNSTKRWPPPVIWGDAPYQAEIIKEDDIEYVQITSGVQTLPIPLFDRKSKSFIYPEKIKEDLQ